MNLSVDKKIKKWGLVGLAYIILMSTWFKAFSGGDGRNTLLIVAMFLSLLILLIHEFRFRLLMMDMYVGSLIFLMFVCAYSHSASWRSSTFFYSCMYFFTFLLFYRIIHTGGIKIHQFLRVNKYLIYAYAVFVVIQQICLIVGIEPVNFTQTKIMFEDTAFRINALSPEPSHVARFMLIFMVSFLSLRSIELKRKYDFFLNVKNDKYVWIAYLWSMLTIGSATAMLYVGLAMLPLLSKKNIVYLVIIACLGIYIVLSIDSRSLDRAINIIPATLSMDINTLFMVDDSAAWRIAPYIIMFKFMNPYSLSFFIGNGIDYQRSLCDKWIIGFCDAAPSGGYLTMIMDYGFLCFAILIFIIFKACYSKTDRFMFWVLMIFVLPFVALNMQIFWCIMMFLTANKYYNNYYLTNQ